MRRRLWAALAATLLLLGAAGSAQACPSCKVANAQDANRPKAYMYSILFMLSMPMTLVTGFGIGFYRLNKRHRDALQARYTDGGVELPETDGPTSLS